MPGEWTEGQKIDIQFDIRGTAAAGGVFFAEVFSELSGGGVSKSEILGGGPLFPNANPEVWTNYKFSTTVGPDSSGGITVQFNSSCGADNNCVADYFIDNVSIRNGEASPPDFELNAGLNDAWYNPETDGQGFFITVFPVAEVVALSWFTYDTVRPAEGVTANLGEPSHRWFNAVGAYSGNQAVLDISIASGGLFDTPTEITKVGDGTIILIFTDCETGTVEYDIPSINQQGTVPIQRVSNDNILLCEELIAK